MTDSPITPRVGYTLPVFACAAAIAALRWLRDQPTSLRDVAIDLLDPPETVTIPIAQVARLSPTTALAITHSDPGDNVDITKGTPVWAMVCVEEVGEWVGGQVGEMIGTEETQDHPPSSTSPTHPLPYPPTPPLTIHGGDGIGRLVNHDNKAAIYDYARRLMVANLTPLLRSRQHATVTLILPEGRALAERTSNAAFGVVEGLSLLGTSGIAQPLSAPGQLEQFRQDLQTKAAQFDSLVFCVGENGLDLATRMGIKPARLVKTANWLGPLLVEAGVQGVQSILLFGYHGKLLKLAGGIFHTHHYVADGRQEILTAYCAEAGLPTVNLQAILHQATAEDGLRYLQGLGNSTGEDWVGRVYGAIAQHIDRRAHNYIHAQSQQRVQVGSVLFGRDRQIIVQSQTATALLTRMC